MGAGKIPLPYHNAPGMGAVLPPCPFVFRFQGKDTEPSPVFNPEIHDGLSYYTSEEYKEYDDAQLFDDFLESLNLNSDLLPVYFYHIDNSNHNTVLYGKVSNMYALDFKADKTTYDEIKSRLLEESTYVEKLHDYEIYSVNGEFADSNGGFLAFCDETNTVRCILIPDRNSNEKSIYNFLIGETSLRFE